MTHNKDEVVEWLLSVDPSIAWQVERDLLGKPLSEYLATRTRVAREGWGAKLLSIRDDDGQWCGGAYLPTDVPWSTWKEVGQPYTATSWALTQLREFGLDPAQDFVQNFIKSIGENSKWDGGQKYWDGETEECINGRTVADGYYYGVDMTPLVERLLGEQQSDGGWNCERCEGSKVSSYATTINVLEGLSFTDHTEERKLGEEYLLKRNLFKKLKDGSVVDEQFVKVAYPIQWRYDILRALDYFRTVGDPDERMSEAIDILRKKQQQDGRWILDWEAKGEQWFKMGEVGEPNPWVTLKALRVLKWWDDWKGNQS